LIFLGKGVVGKGMGGRGGRSVKEITSVIILTYLLILGRIAKLSLPQGPFRKGGTRERQTCVC